MAWRSVFFFRFFDKFLPKELLGRNLYELITEQQGLLPVQLVYEATRQVLSALEYLNLAWEDQHARWAPKKVGFEITPVKPIYNKAICYAING